MTKIWKIFKLIIITLSLLNLISCTQVMIGGATSGGVVLLQERSAKQAAIDLLAKTQIEEAMFSTSYDKLFSKIRVIVYEGKALLVGTVEKIDNKENAENIAWKTKNIKEVANYIQIGKTNLVDYIKDTRISLEFKAKLLTDKDISEVNFISTTENRVLYVIGIATSNEEEKVINHASEVAGVKKIINLIKIKENTNSKN
tara:strand:+ start:183 stop:782 length:600 start_codon:yes stop_codon:yes gene_type:complete